MLMVCAVLLVLGFAAVAICIAAAGDVDDDLPPCPPPAVQASANGKIAATSEEEGVL